MQTSDTKEFNYWNLIAGTLAFLLAVTAVTTIATGVFDPVLWTVVIAPLALLGYAYKRCD